MKVWGWSEDRRRALCVFDATETRDGFVAIVHSVGDRLAESGRWECSPAHLDAYAELYRSRFPVAS